MAKVLFHYILMTLINALYYWKDLISDWQFVHFDTKIIIDTTIDFYYIHVVELSIKMLKTKTLFQLSEDYLDY
jgi:hypothetical protein